ncbi:hypothetical protein B0H17DRAFT_1206116 [Mycena rosella]|uniref:Uncharacterized protein n=1 Tax=Mycena rosella TaxID=1033263 RepID=A0AAD7D5P8_MYCRO|nr:hypothetical protein B0H17DRAFT_1206116 [Mycena rosella]
MPITRRPGSICQPATALHGSVLYCTGLSITIHANAKDLHPLRFDDLLNVLTVIAPHPRVLYYSRLLYKYLQQLTLYTSTSSAWKCLYQHLSGNAPPSIPGQDVTTVAGPSNSDQYSPPHRRNYLGSGAASPAFVLPINLAADYLRPAHG